MKNKILIIFFILSISYMSIWSINRYEPELIKHIPDGNGKGEVRIDCTIPGCYPHTYAIDNNDILYIFDSANSRVNMYDLDLNYIGEIIDSREYGVSYSSYVIFDNKNNFIAYDEPWGVGKYNRNSNLTWAITKKEYNMDIRNIFPYENYIFFTNDKNEIFFVNDKGHILNDNETKVLLYHINNNVHSTLRDNKGLTDKLDSYLEQNNLLLVGDRLFNKSFSIQKKYFLFVKENIKDFLLKNNAVVDFESSELYQSYYLGYDINDNLYRMHITNNDFTFYIFSKYGEVIDIFKCKRVAGYAVMTKYGDLYFMNLEEDGVSFYRIKNRWSNK